MEESVYNVKIILSYKILFPIPFFCRLRYGYGKDCSKDKKKAATQTRLPPCGVQSDF